MSSAVLAGAVSGSAGARVGCGADAGTAGRADADAGGRVEADAGGRAEADAGGRAVADAADLATGGASLAYSAVPRSRAFLAGARPAGRFWPGGVTGIRPAGVFLADVRPTGMSWAGARPGGALAGIRPADAPDGAGPADAPGAQAGRCRGGVAAVPPGARSFRVGCSSCSSSSAASSSFPGWHHIVAARTGRRLNGSLRADDVSMKTPRPILSACVWLDRRLEPRSVPYKGFQISVMRSPACAL